MSLQQALAAENKRLNSRNVALQAKIISLNNRIEALEAQIKNRADGSLQQLVGQIFQRARATKAGAKSGSESGGHT